MRFAKRDPLAATRTRYVAGVALGVALLYTAFVLVNTVVVGPTALVPLPGLSSWLYMQDALDIVAAALLIAGGAAVLDRLLARDQALQAATLSGMARVTALARTIGETAEVRERVPEGAGRETPAAVTELAATFNAMLARLEAAFERQRQLVADTSHELRNPLTVLRANLAVLQREDADPQLRLDAARDAEEEAARLGRLVDDLLLLTRGASGELLQRRTVRLDTLLADVAEEAQEAGTGHHIVLDAPEPLTLDADPERLRQVLRNLVGNALRHTPPGTTVRLSASQTDNALEIVITDDGPGIAAKHLPRVFDRFYRVDVARSRAALAPTAASGAGLGLPIVKHLVEAHGGAVTLHSEVGQGTSVRVALPLSIDAGAALC